MKLIRKLRRQTSRDKTRGKCAEVRSTDLKGGRRAPPGDRGACERQTKSQGSE